MLVCLVGKHLIVPLNDLIVRVECFDHRVEVSSKLTNSFVNGAAHLKHLLARGQVLQERLYPIHFLALKFLREQQSMPADVFLHRLQLVGVLCYGVLLKLKSIALQLKVNPDLRVSRKSFGGCGDAHLQIFGTLSQHMLTGKVFH